MSSPSKDLIILLEALPVILSLFILPSMFSIFAIIKSALPSASVSWAIVLLKSTVIPPVPKAL